MNRFIVIAFFFIITKNVAGQYGDAYHAANQAEIDKNRKAYNDAYINALSKNNNSKSSSSGKVNANAAQELADLFASRAGRVTSNQKSESELKAARDRATAEQQKAIEERARVEAHYKDEDERREYIMAPLRQEYKAVGFADFEVGYFCYDNMDVTLNDSKTKTLYYSRYSPEAKLAKEAFLKFNEKVNSAGFEELFDLISDFNVAPYSAYLSMEKLALRFPEKKPLLNAVGMINTAAFWGDRYAHTRYSQYYFAPPEVKKILLDKFTFWLNAYPEAALVVAVKAISDNSPLKLLTKKALDDNKPDEALRFALMAMQVPRFWKGSQPSLSKDIITSYSFLFRGNKLKKFDIKASDIKRIAIVHELPIPRVIEWFYGLETNQLCKPLKHGDGTLYYHTGTFFFDAGFDKILREFGEAGDGEALNAYAISVAYGKQKERPNESINMLVKAAGLGSSQALSNLKEMPKWGLKWLGKQDVLAIEEKLNFISASVAPKGNSGNNTASSGLATLKDKRIAALEKIAANLRTKGFPRSDAEVVAQYLEPFEDGKNVLDKKSLNTLNEEILAFEKFIKLKTSGSYNELMELTRQFPDFPLSGIFVQEIIVSRFPEKQVETDKEQFKSISGFYLCKLNKGKDVRLKTPDFIANDAENKYVADRFFDLYTKYPQEALVSLDRNKSNNPIIYRIKIAEQTNDQKALLYYKTLNEQVKYK